jgi:molecular chaperone DnaK
MHIDEDRKKKELVDAHNMADSLIYTTEKTMTEMGGKVEPSLRVEVEESINNLKQVIKSEDTATIRQRTDTLNQAAHKLAQNIYQQPGAEAPYNHGSGSQTGGAADSERNKDDIIDAEFQEVA